MASFTDTPPKFTPYIPNFPLELIGQAGMYKQQKYEENVQKIQGEIDKIAGLDILRDVDKAHLQSRLNELGNNLTYMSAGDFSNFQLVNSVSGMTKQLTQDKNIQTAVSSTAWYRKQVAEMEKAISEGKSSQSNIWDFNEKANRYISSTDLGRSFSDRYTQYTDVKKKAMDAIKALHPELQKYDIPFEIVDGNVTKSIADAMKRYKIEGIDEGQIKAAISATLTPDDLNQLTIDGRYQFRNIDPNQLATIATNNYNTNKTEAISTLNYLNEKKQITTDPTTLDKLEKQIDYYKSLVGEPGKTGLLDDQLAIDLKNARENPDGVKASIYKDGFIKEFANAFSWKNTEMEYVTNPIRQQMNWVEEQKLRIQKENRERYEFSVTSAQKEREIAISEANLKLKARENALKEVELYGIESPWTTVGNETTMKLKASEILTEHADSVANDYKGGESTLKNAGYTQEQINMMVNDVNSKVPANAMSVVQQMRKNKNYLSALEDFQKQTRAEADKEAGVSEISRKSIIGKPSLNLTWNNQNFNLSPSEILQIKSATTTKTTPSRGGNRREVSVDTTGFNTNQMKFVNAMQGILYGKFEPGPQPAGVDALRGKINSVLTTYDGAVKSVGDAIRKSNEIYNEKLAPRVSKFVPQIKALPLDKDGSLTPVTLQRMAGLVQATIARGVKADANYSPEKVSEMLLAKNNKDTRIFVQQSGNDFEVQVTSLSDPSNVQRIKVNKAELIANLGPQYVNELTQESIRVGIGAGNTNLTRDPNRSVMQKAIGDFPGIRRMNVTADLDQDLSNPDLFIPGINIKKKNGRYEFFQLSGVDNLSRVGYEQGIRNLNALTDDVLLKYLKVEYPNYDYSQLDIK